MRIIAVADLAKQTSGRIFSEGLQPDYRKIRQKIPAGVEHLYCGGTNSNAARIGNLLALDYLLPVQFDKRLEDIEKWSEKLHGLQQPKNKQVQRKIFYQETVSLCMFHLQEFMNALKKLNRNNILIVTNEFGCQLLLTYALGISADAVQSFSINAGSVILLDIHDMSSMNKIYF